MKQGLEVALIGTLGRMPSFKRVGEQATACLSFTAAVDTGAEQPEWVAITCWADVAENLEDCLKPGDSVYCEGKARIDRWKPEDGPERAMLKVSARVCQPMGKIGRRASSPSGSNERRRRPQAKPSGPSRSTVDSRGYDRGEPFR